MDDLYKLTKEQLIERLTKQQNRSSFTEYLETHEPVFSAFIKNTDEIVYIIDTEGIFQLSEGKGLTKLGLLPGEVVGKSAFELYKDFPKIVNSIKNSIKGIVETYDVNVGGVYFKNWITPLSDKSGNINSVLGLSVDITKQKEIEIKYKQSEELLNNAIDNAAIGMCQVDMNGYFIKANRNLCEMLGYSEAELIEKKFQDITHKADITIGAEAVKRLQDDDIEQIQFEKRYIKKNGEVINALVNSVVIKDNEKKPLFFFTQLINQTQSKKDEEQLLLSKNKWQSTFDAMKNSVSIIDMNGKIIQYNKATLDLFNLDEKKLQNLTCSQIVHKCDDPFPNCPMVKMKESQKSESMTYREGDNWLRVNVDPIFDDYKKLIGAVHIISDITESKEAEDKLEQQMHYIEDVLEGTNAGTWNWNIQTSELLLNERWAEIMGYSLSELEPIDVNTWSNNIHQEDLKVAKDQLDKHFNGEIEYYDVMFRQPHKNGTWVWVHARGKVISWDNAGKPLRISGIHLDVTVQQEALEELNKHRENLEKLINERTEELEAKNKELDNALKVFVGREKTIVDLQKRIKAMESN